MKVSSSASVVPHVLKPCSASVVPHVLKPWFNTATYSMWWSPCRVSDGMNMWRVELSEVDVVSCTSGNLG